jgi:hypothetical protein
LRLDVKTASVGLGGLTVRAGVSSRLQVGPRRAASEPPRPEAAGVYHFGGSRLEIRNATVTREVLESSRESSDSGWWARIDLPELDFRPATPAVRARAVTRLRDAGLVLTVVDRFVKFPVKMLEVLASGEVDARGTVHLAPGSFALDGLEASGGDTLHTKGWLHSGRTEKRGAFLVEIGKTALGIHVTPAKTELVTKSPREWFAGVEEAKAK